MGEIYRWGNDLYYKWNLGSGAYGVLTQDLDLGLSPNLGSPSMLDDMIKSPAVFYKKLVTYKAGYDDTEPTWFEFTRYIGVGQTTGKSYNARCSFSGFFDSTTSSAERFTYLTNNTNTTTDKLNSHHAQMLNYDFVSSVIYFVNVMYTRGNEILGWGIYRIERIVFEDGTTQYGGDGGYCAGGGPLSNGSNVYCETNDEDIIFDGAKYFEKVEEDNTPDTTGGGGYGGGVNPTDTTGIPPLPTLNLNVSGSSLYALTESQMQQFTAWLWTSDWSENIKKIRTDSMENVIGVAVCDIDLGGIEAPIYLGNINSGISALITSRWVEVDCGTISIDEYYGSYGDYEPYVNFILYLPKVGFVSIPADILVNNKLKVVYHCEMSSGEGLCILYVTDTRHDFSYVYNTYSCNVCANVPLSASNHTQQMIASANAVVNSTISAATGNVSGLASSAMSVATAKVPTQTKGNLGNMSALMSHKKPYLLINATYLTKPSGLRANSGHAIFATEKLGDLNGYVQCMDYRVDFECPESIQGDIEAKLNGGVYIE